MQPALHRFSWLLSSSNPYCCLHIPSCHTLLPASSYQFRFAITKRLASKVTNLSVQIIISSFIRKLKSWYSFAYWESNFQFFFFQKFQLEFCSISLPYPYELVSRTFYFPWLITLIIFGKVLQFFKTFIL